VKNEFVTTTDVESVTTSVEFEPSLKTYDIVCVGEREIVRVGVRVMMGQWNVSNKVRRIVAVRKPTVLLCVKS
jgi:hypothetical protein